MSVGTCGGFVSRNNAMEGKAWAGPRPHHKKSSGHSSPHLVSLGIPSRQSNAPSGLSLQIPGGVSPTKAVAFTEERGSSLERTKSLNEMQKGQTELLQEIYERGKEVQALMAQRDELREKVAQLNDQIKPLRTAAQGIHEKDQTIEQLQEAILASKYEVANLRHQLGLYESASREICGVLERGHLTKEDRVRVLNCIRTAARDTHDMQSSRSSPMLPLEDTGDLEQLFIKVQRRDRAKGKLSGLKSPYRAPPASFMTLGRQLKASTSMRKIKSPRSLVQTVRSLSPGSTKTLDQQCEEIYARLKHVLEGWRLAYEKKQLL